MLGSSPTKIILSRIISFGNTLFFYYCNLHEKSGKLLNFSHANYVFLLLQMPKKYLFVWKHVV